MQLYWVGAADANGIAAQYNHGYATKDADSSPDTA
jgi:hypothetical protein